MGCMVGSDYCLMCQIRPDLTKKQGEIYIFIRTIHSIVYLLITTGILRNQLPHCNLTNRGKVTI